MLWLTFFNVIKIHTYKEHMLIIYSELFEMRKIIKTFKGLYLLVT